VPSVPEMDTQGDANPYAALGALGIHSDEDGGNERELSSRSTPPLFF
jgi:hypothetical protein